MDLKFGSPLSEDLRAKFKRRSVRPTVGDSVRIVRGEFRNIEGKVTKVLPKKGKVNVEGVTREKIKGGTAPAPIDASKVVVTAFNLEDKLRKSKLGSVGDGKEGRKEQNEAALGSEALGPR